MDKRKTFMDAHQALDWVNALSEAESDGGEVSGFGPCTCTSLIYFSLHFYHYTFKISILAVSGTVHSESWWL